MGYLSCTLCIILFVLSLGAQTSPTPYAYDLQLSGTNNSTVPPSLFLELEELSRLVGISYCVGYQGIQYPFECLSHCSDFKGFELVETWETSILEGNSCGFIALSHAPHPQRIIVAFRGTNSFANAIYDLQTAPAEYVPYEETNGKECRNCSVHSGFMRSWNATKAQILPTLKSTVERYPEYELVLAGHSLGGAVAGLAALDFRASGWDLKVTTFGEPCFGNSGLAEFVDKSFASNNTVGNYRRVTHVNDPVPFLPPKEWSWRQHAGEIYISKRGLPPSVADLHLCEGSEDADCLDGADHLATDVGKLATLVVQNPETASELVLDASLGIPTRWQIWQLLFAHREYFWRLGLCFDPQWRSYDETSGEK